MKSLSIKVKPNARQQVIRHKDDGSLTVQLTAVITWVSHSASILLACVSETLTLFGVAYSNGNCCKSPPIEGKANQELIQLLGTGIK